MTVEFRRLTEVPLEDLVELFNHADVRRHLPLATGPFTAERCAAFVRAKERIWEEHGYGPFAFFVDGRFAGWGGLQPEGPDVDLGMVLHPRFWGLGIRLVRDILALAFGPMGLPSVIVLLPPSRTRLRALRRLGFEVEDEVLLGGERFVRYRLEAPVASPARA
jgi:RimJ/RimL family protein N-acetyltransferase